MKPVFDPQLLQLGTPCSIRGNQSIRLNDAQAIWIVQAGEIAIFRIGNHHESAPGTRRYLFSCEPGEALFGVLPPQNGQSELLAISVEPTDMVCLQPENLAAWLEVADSEGKELLKTWVQKIQTFIDHNSSDSLLDSDPAGRDLPFAALDSSSEITLDTLLQLNHQFVQYLDHFEAQTQIGEWEQFQLKNQLRQQLNQETIAGLASVIYPHADQQHRQTVAHQGNPEQMAFLNLYGAVRAVAHASGITLRSIKSDNLARLQDPLQAIAQASRIRIRRVLLTNRWWRKDCGSLLAYRQSDNQPVALIALAPGRYELFDPAQGARLPINAKTQPLLSPIAYMLYRPLPERALQVFDVLQFGLKGSAHDWAIVVWAGIAITVLGMLLPQGTAILIDHVLPDADQGLLVQLGIALLIATFGGLVFQLAQGVALMRIETLMETSTQTAFWDRLLGLNAPFFRHYSIGDLRERVSVISAIRSQIGGTVFRTLFTSSFACLNLVLLFYYGGQLAWIACGVALLMAGVTALFGNRLLVQLIPLQELEGKLFGLMVQFIHGVVKLRISGTEERAFAHWGQRYRRQQQLKLRMQQIEDNLLVCNQLLPLLSAAIVFSVAAGMSRIQSPHGFSTGSFLAFNVALTSFMLGVTDLSNTLLNLLTAVVLWKRAKPILQAMPEVDSGKTEPGLLSGRLLLDHITFRYRPDGPAILNDVTISVQPGEFIAIVGPSGSGKSTLFRLLLGFETPQSGQVYYDGQNLRDLNIHAVRRQLGVLLQNSRTSTASIFENIAGNALITMDEAWEAARYAGLANDIEAMPMGMHTIVSEGGSNLSGGQRQRLLIARSLALKPRILLFDEATSSLDNRTQAIVSDSLERLQITRLVIAHRLSTIQHADRIYVLQAGRIVQQGRFEELIQQDGLFFQLMQQQIA